MIGRLRGQVIEVDGERVLLDVHGVGYDVVCTSALSARLEVGAEVHFSVHTDVREDAIRLFGFDSPVERQIFLLLNRVSGMGPRSSLDVVSNVAIRDLLHAIGSGNVQALMSIKGVGKKKAERIVVELRDLVANVATERSSAGRDAAVVGGAGMTGSRLAADAAAALEVLGFTRRDAEAAVAKGMESLGSGKDVGDLVREALKFV
jgi:Holliday junction DNA helicase RuvA